LVKNINEIHSANGVSTDWLVTPAEKFPKELFLVRDSLPSII